MQQTINIRGDIRKFTVVSIFRICQIHFIDGRDIVENNFKQSIEMHNFIYISHNMDTAITITTRKYCPRPVAFCHNYDTLKS